MRKHKKHAAPNLSPIFTLRPRLDALWGNPALSQQTDAALGSAMDAIARGVKADAFLQTILAAYLATPTPTRARLDAFVPRWLRERNLLPTLEALTAQGALQGEPRKQAIAWLTANGVSLQLPEPTPTDLFYQAYDLNDKSQAFVTVLWYVNPKKNRLHGINFLIDHNPPWDGAVKDVMVYPHLDPRDMMRRYIDFWKERGQALTPIDGATAKTRVLHALECNRASEIRLPHDLIANRDAFARFVLALPDAPDTPTFTDDDWTFLRNNGQTPEAISHYEQTVGRRVRMDDGKELLVMGAPGWDDEV